MKISSKSIKFYIIRFSFYITFIFLILININAAVTTSSENVTESEKVDVSSSKIEQFYQNYKKGKYVQFGYNFFSSNETSSIQVVDPNYVLGPDDTINVQIWGNSLYELVEGANGGYINHKLIVNQNGYLIFPEIGVIAVNGLSLSKLEKIISLKYRNFCKDCTTITALENPRSYPVLVSGYVKNPGYVKIRAGATLYDALLRTGGVTKQGTLRNIRITKSNKNQETVDLYQFIIHGKINELPKIGFGDSIYVGIIGPTVLLNGHLKNPAILEFKDNESLNEILSFSGGLLPDTNGEHIELTRFKKSNRSIMILNDLKRTIHLKNGDMIRFLRQNTEITNTIQLNGHVKTVQQFSWNPKLLLRDVIKDFTIFKSEASLEYAEIRRFDSKNATPRVFNFNPNRLINGDLSQNIPLQPRDQIWIFSIHDVKEKAIVSISGAIKKSGNYEWIEDTTLMTIINKAGGVQHNAADEIRIVRHENLNKEWETSLKIASFEEMKKDPNKDIFLKPYDHIVVTTQNDFYRTLWQVSISGAVKFPGSYSIGTQTKLSEIVKIAGKKTLSDEVRVVRYKFINKKWSTSLIKISLNEIEKEPEKDIILKPHDKILIPKQSDSHQTNWQVSIEGAVKFPGMYPIGSHTKLSDLIGFAGNITPDAYLPSLTLIRKKAKNVQTDFQSHAVSLLKKELIQATSDLESRYLKEDERQQNKQFISIVQNYLTHLESKQTSGRILLNPLELDSLEKLTGTNSDLILQNGDNIYIPKTPDFISIVGEVYQPASYLFEKNKKLSEYLEQSGGVSKYADLPGSFIIRFDGTVLSYQQKQEKFVNTILLPGDVFLLPSKVLKKMGLNVK